MYIERMRDIATRSQFFPTHMFRVAGVTFEGRQSLIRDIIERTKRRDSTLVPDESFVTFPHEHVVLQPEYDNQYDENAVQVLLNTQTVLDSEPRTVCLGYVPRLRCTQCSTTFSDNMKRCPHCPENTEVQVFNKQIGQLIKDHASWTIMSWAGTYVVGGSLGVGIYCRLGHSEYYREWEKFWNLSIEANDNQAILEARHKVQTSLCTPPACIKLPTPTSHEYPALERWYY